MVGRGNVGENEQLHSAVGNQSGAKRLFQSNLNSCQLEFAPAGSALILCSVRFSIVTPSFHQLELLKQCARSVADQEVEAEHIIQDGGTGPELENWVRSETSADLVMESDAGMYDALNRGFARATGDLWAWLNCDEQYLPGALQAVEQRFAAEPELDVLLADNLIIDPEGNYLAHRFSLVPTSSQMWVRFPVASCALFFRRRVWRPFDTQWKSAGDWWWFRRLLTSGAKIGVLRRFVAVFTESDANLGRSPLTVQEQLKIRDARPWWVRISSPAILALHRWRMWRSGAFAVKPLRYAIYTRADSSSATTVADSKSDESIGMKRREFFVSIPTARWVRPPAPSGVPS